LRSSRYQTWNRQIYENKEDDIMVAKIKVDDCVGCGICTDECPAGAIVLDNDKAKVDEDKCTDCGTCESSCPNDAITVG
jgi:ferredoxin